MRSAAGTLQSCVAAICLLVGGTAHAHGGLSMDDDLCKLRVGPYNMHFTGYQPAINGNREFCEDIPAAGATIIVMDALDPALRELPIEVRIIRDPGSGASERVAAAQLEALTVLHRPPEIYVTGSVPVRYTFDQPGRFVGLVYAGAEGEFVSRFPFSVGIEKRSYGYYLLALGAVLLGYGLYRHASRRRAQSDNNPPKTYPLD